MDIKEPIETPRLILKNLSIEDANSPYKDWVRDPEVNRYLELRHSPPNESQISEFISSMNHSSDNLFLGIFLKNFTHIGNIKLGPINLSNHRAIIGLLIGDKSSWGRGYASESIEAISKYAFNHLKLNKVEAGCYSSNIGSYKAFLNAGFKHEGTLKNHWKIGNDWEDELLIGKSLELN
mgnify:CR=1 FL=1